MTALTPAADTFTLTDEQRAAVEWGDGPLMVLAGAGTGKTTVIVERVRWMLGQRSSGAGTPGDGVTPGDGSVSAAEHLAPENILVLTYNVRAAAELIHRLEQALGVQTASRLWVHNFHSFGYRLLNNHRAEIGLQDAGNMLDGVGQRLLLLDLRPQLAHFLYHDLSLNPIPSLGRFADAIARAKDELVTPDEYAAYVEARKRAFVVQFGDWEETIETLRRRRAANELKPIWEVRRELRKARTATDDGLAAATKAADRVARRQASGINYAVRWDELDRAQRDLANGLKPTYLKEAAAFEVLRLQEEAEVYALYQRTIHERGLVDFGEQQLRAIELLQDYPNLLLRYQRQFRHVLVDEFQDANMAQILLLELIGRGPDKPDNVVVVGDDDQSIYRFRGASYAAFRQFEDRFGRAPTWAPDRPAAPVARLPLLDNRRSTARILSAADRLIDHNAGRLKAGQPLRPTKGVGEAVELVYAADEADEADKIVERLQAAYEALPAIGTDGRPKRWSDLVVLYRRHRHREAIVERLRRAGIPYTLIGGTGLFLQPEVRDLEAALRVCADPTDSVSFARLMTAGPWRFDAVEILGVRRSADFDHRPMWQAAAELRAAGADAGGGADAGAGSDAGDGTDSEARASEAPEPATRLKLDRLFEVIEPLAARATREGPFTILEAYLEATSLLHDLIAVETPEAQRTVLAVARLMRFVADWEREHPRGSLADFIAYLDLYHEVGGDLEPEGRGGVQPEGAQLMTVYQAKGLEYEVVVVPRLIDGQFPDTREENLLIPVELLKQTPPDEFAIAEERRLCFVAMTRARIRLIMTTIDSPDWRQPPSRFLGEIEGDEVIVSRAELQPEAGVGSGPRSEWEAARAADQSEARAEGTEATTTASLLRLMPVPSAFERRYALRRRAVELIGALEQVGPDDPAGRDALIDELLVVARDAADEAEVARRNGIDPVTLRVLGRHAPAGQTLLALTALPEAFSHSQFTTYQACPLRYAFERVYAIPTLERRGYFEFGSAVHAAFEAYSTARHDARAAGIPEPGFEALQEAFERVYEPHAFDDAEAAEHYRRRSEPVLRRFFDRELASLSEAVAFEQEFVLDLDPGDGAEPVRVRGFIDRIDRGPDGSIEVIDYKTGRAKTQAQVDADEQLSTYALALAIGAVTDPLTGERLPAASRLTLYFTESDLSLSTTRSAEQLEAHRANLLALAARIRSGDFTATPDQWACGRCDYARLCPSRWGETG